MADVDVLLPFHRVDAFLAPAVASIRTQRGVSTRLILVDDRPGSGRRDSVAELVRSGDVLLDTGGGCGYGEALRVGTQAIESAAMCLMNSDDISLESRLQLQLQQLDEHDLSITRVKSVDASLRALPSVTGEADFTPYSAQFLLLGSYGSDASWCARSNWWRSAAFFDALPSLDWRIGLRSMKSASIGAVPSVQYLYRKHMQQVTRDPIASLAFDTVYGDWAALNSDFDLPVLNLDTARVAAAAWERVGPDVDADALHAWARQLVADASDFGTVESVRRILSRRFSIRGVLGPANPKIRTKLLARSLPDVPRFGFDAARVIATRLR